MATITMIDYGIGNYRSVEKALAHVGGDVVRTADADKIASAQKLILIGNGSGLAGLRAHLKERESNKQHDNWLIYGERSPHTDRHWDETLSDWLEIGHLTYLDRSFSRAGDTDLSSVVGNAYPGYVQNVVDYQAERLAQWLSEGAIIMVCGSRDGMASDLDQRLQTLLGAEAVAQLSTEGRYRRDVY